ncbi:glycoside hydrolase family 68 protein [Streptococcus mutans]|uniref:glycoside hydrolase family 68 protein n=1 Tax=Streptococcus mutans TaxID=1309 RepID=UPI0002B57827|nr:glycoside hydrolase family 68 protein [Streptococcus mutans]EMB86898.1 levansucrase precursor [Streptococcus mutans A9]MCB4930534.1 glycoside hydrolase family 68 protein [Streptococcus mutans]MCB5006922.1 glycoside hydrolase family 68 protein [Streptococcus mutans]MCB5036499.1 glycoside hydrolase family 68 protein [Streptococcus mutans]
METKVRKKMYKKGKFWVVATITTAMLTGIGLSSVQADEANSTQVSSELAERSQVQENTTASSSAAENQAKTEVQETPSTNPAAATVENTDQTTKVITDNAAVESKASKTKDQAATVTKTAASTPEVGQTNEKAKATKEADITTPKNTIDEYGLTEQARKIATEAGINLSSLTQKQVEALNKVKLTSDAQTGHQMTYQEFDKIAQTLIAQDERYAIPYFNAKAIKNMKAATTRDAQTGQIADLDVWDSWPVQDAKTGEVINWNGYQLVVAMMGIPNTNDNHIYLLYNKYGDNNFDHWKNAGSIFGYNETPLTQEWSGSATVNEDGSLQLFYTKVDTSDKNSNNQRLATATVNLGFDDQDVRILSVENDKVLTPEGGDGYHYQSYQQWRSTFTGADNIAMRDPHVIEDEKGDRYLVFEASTGTENYQGEDQIYNFTNYGGSSAYNVKSLFRFLDDQDMYNRASWANAAIGILKLKGDKKTPEVDQFYTPLLSSTMVSDELERPNVVKLGDKYYLFTASRLNHGSNNDAWNKANEVVGDNVVMLGYVSDQLTNGYKPLNNSGVVLTASVPADWRTATYSYYAVPVAGSSDTLLMTAYMTNRNEVAGKGKNSTWAPSFLIQVLPDGTTKVLAEMTQQGDWIWDEPSRTTDTVGTLDTAYLPDENDGYIDWNVIGGYGLKPHTPGQYQPTVPSTPIHTDDIISFEVSFDGHLVIKPVKVNNDSAGRIDQSRNSGGSLNVAFNVSAGGNISVKPSQKSINNTKETKKAHHVSTEKKQKKGNSFFAALLALFSAFCVSIGFK